MGDRRPHNIYHIMYCIFSMINNCTNSIAIIVLLTIPIYFGQLTSLTYFAGSFHAKSYRPSALILVNSPLFSEICLDFSAYLML